MTGDPPDAHTLKTQAPQPDLSAPMSVYPLVSAEVRRHKQVDIDRAVAWVQRVVDDVTTAEQAIALADEYLSAYRAGVPVEAELQKSLTDIDRCFKTNLAERVDTAFGTLGQEVRLADDEEGMVLWRQHLDVARRAEQAAQNRDKVTRQIKSSLAKGQPRAKMERVGVHYRVDETPSSEVQKGIGNLLERSVSKVPEEAMREWEYAQEVMEDGDPDFPGQCEICHVQNVRSVYLIRNRINDRIAWVGAECVLRYTRPEGTSTAEDVRQVFNKQERERQNNDVIAMTIAALLSNKDHKIGGDDLGWFQSAIRSKFGVNGAPEIRASQRVDEVMSQIVGAPWVRFSRARETREAAALIYAAVFEPSKVLRLRRDGKPEYEEQTIGGRRARVRTTVARGEHTRSLGY